LHNRTVTEEVSMKDVVLDLPTFGFVVGTRVALGAGVGLLVADKLSGARRRVLGTILVAAGALTTIPAAISVMRGVGKSTRRGMGSPVGHDNQLIGATRFPRKGDDIL
jgi:hypothetical protein